ncbi:hypothetical protein [Paracidovorax anthurii]|uniref:Uncharacterized protein n=1 Tax=Paracidovorax anthurii TaxID=78229 RepID=A0A328ZUU1_9BURK|nr:hypothetical protein [Paracidovorax anthurii]RAR86627.1 hypothetical protein AX018_1001214 [Paracidovorax anthurii]WCM93291.1 hypothetical protein M5C99_00730 [Acidovorax sp. NCPPB 2350]
MFSRVLSIRRLLHGDRAQAHRGPSDPAPSASARGACPQAGAMPARDAAARTRKAPSGAMGRRPPDLKSA